MKAFAIACVGKEGTIVNNRGVYQVSVINQQGVSLLETLIGLFSLLVIVSLFSSVFTYWTAASPEINEFSYEEYILFIQQLQMEFKQSDQYWVNDQNNKLYMLRQENDDIVHFEKYQDKVRRQVRGVGHEVFIQQINNFRVYERAYGVEIEITTENGKLNRGIIHPLTFQQNLVPIGEE